MALQRRCLPPVLCNASLKPPYFHHSGTVSGLKISSSMPWTLRWRKDPCQMHFYSLPPGAKVQGWFRWEGDYLDGGSLHKSFMLDHSRAQNTIPKDTSRGMVILSAMLTVNPRDVPLPFLCPAMKESYCNPDVSSAKTFPLFINPLACFVGLWAEVAEQQWDLQVDTEERYWLAKGSQNFRTWKWMMYLMPV